MLTARRLRSYFAEYERRIFCLTISIRNRTVAPEMGQLRLSSSVFDGQASYLTYTKDSFMSPQDMTYMRNRSNSPDAATIKTAYSGNQKWDTSAMRNVTLGSLRML